MKGSPEAFASPDADLYDAEHGRYVLWMSPGVGSMKMLEFSQVTGLNFSIVLGNRTTKGLYLGESLRLIIRFCGLLPPRIFFDCPDRCLRKKVIFTFILS